MVAMASCEMCGVERELVHAVVEGTLLAVCQQCSTYGNVVAIEKQRVTSGIKRVLEVEAPTHELVEDYGKLVKEQREKMGLTQEDLAKQIQEKASFLHKIENNQFKPSVALAQKLEKVLQIRLIEHVAAVSKVPVNIDDAHLTIGDLIKFKRKQ